TPPPCVILRKIPTRPGNSLSTHKGRLSTNSLHTARISFSVRCGAGRNRLAPFSAQIAIKEKISKHNEYSAQRTQGKSDGLPHYPVRPDHVDHRCSFSALRRACNH